MGVAVEKIANFNHQNVMMDMLIADIDPAKNDGKRFQIHINSSYDCYASFQAKRIMVSMLVPYKEGLKIQTPRRGRAQPLIPPNKSGPNSG
jgi:hypothetical protein